jgi:hypothetical protein
METKNFNQIKFTGIKNMLSQDEMKEILGGSGAGCGDGSTGGDAGDWWNGNPDGFFLLPEVTVGSGSNSSGYYGNYYTYYNNDPYYYNWGSSGNYGGGSGSSTGSGTDNHHYYDPDSEQSKRMWGALFDGGKGVLSVTGIAVDISKVVDTLSEAQLRDLKQFGRNLGLTGIVLDTITVGVNIQEEGHFDANDALAVGGIVLGTIALVATGPAAIALGVGGLVVSIIQNTGYGDDDILIDKDDVNYLNYLWRGGKR